MGRAISSLTDAGLQAWSLNFHNRLAAAPSAYGTTAEAVAAYGVLQVGYAEALAMVLDPATRTEGVVAAKNTARQSLLLSSRNLISIIDGHGLTDEQRINLGLHVRKHPAPVPAPTEAPELDASAGPDRMIDLRAHGEGGQRRRLAGTDGLQLFTHTGPTPPASAEGWTFRGTTGRTRTTLQIAGTEATTVWITARWYNARGAGPACPPRSVNLPAATEPPAAQMKLAA